MLVDAEWYWLEKENMTDEEWNQKQEYADQQYDEMYK